MLSTSTIDKENQVGPVQRVGGTSKHRKALGDAGYGSKNASTTLGKGASFPRPNTKPRLAPLGSHPMPASKAPSMASRIPGGLGTKPKEQRRKLGDISNRKQDSTMTKTESVKGLIVKDGSSASGLAVKKPGLAAKTGAPSSSNGIKKSLSSTAPPKTTERPKAKLNNIVDVPDIEMALGRLGDEEEALVQRRQEQRFADSMVEPFRVSKPSKSSAGGRRDPRAPGASPRMGLSRLSSPKRTVGSEQRKHSNKRRLKRTGENQPKANTGDESLEKAIDRMAQDDLEELRQAKPECHLDDGLGFLPKQLGDGPCLAADEHADLGSSPAGPLDDSFLTEDLEFNFA